MGEHEGVLLTLDEAPENLEFGEGKDAGDLFITDGSNTQACQAACDAAGDDCAGWAVEMKGKGPKAKALCQLYATITESTENARMKGFRSCTVAELNAFNAKENEVVETPLEDDKD